MHILTPDAAGLPCRKLAKKLTQSSASAWLAAEACPEKGLDNGSGGNGRCKIELFWL
jgi:hypothetical protein